MSQKDGHKIYNRLKFAFHEKLTAYARKQLYLLLQQFVYNTMTY